MTSRKDVVRALIMRIIADDYEDFDMVVAEAYKRGAARNLLIEPNEISRTLTELLREGYAAAYRLPSATVPPDPLPAVITPEDEPDCYFLLTKAGKIALDQINLTQEFDDI